MNGSMESTTEALEHIKFQLSLLRLTALPEQTRSQSTREMECKSEPVTVMSELEQEAYRQRTR